MSLRYISPVSGELLKPGANGDLYDANGVLTFKSDEGSYDFVVDAPSQEERAHYDSTYAEGGWYGGDESLDEMDYEKLWDLEPGCKDYLASIGDVKGKEILLLGNGTSIKELWFVKLGAHVTFTDLSFQGVLFAKRRYKKSKLGTERPAACEFHAANAYFLPFADNTFDVVCADAVIHHLEDLRKLFAGIYRCLKPGGVCRFLDTAYSPVWQKAKKGALHKLQKYVHRKHGISPEDQKATERGGYTRPELESLMVELGFRRLHYQRVALLDYVLWRTRCKFKAPWLLAFRPLIRRFDRLLAKTAIMERQGIGLVLGFDK